MNNITVIDMPSAIEVYGDVHPYSKEGFNMFKKWCAENGVTYYGRVKSDFSMAEAYKLAEAEGNSQLIVENLS